MTIATRRMAFLAVILMLFSALFSPSLSVAQSCVSAPGLYIDDSGGTLGSV